MFCDRSIMMAAKQSDIAEVMPSASDGFQALHSVYSVNMMPVIVSVSLFPCGIEAEYC